MSPRRPGLVREIGGDYVRRRRQSEESAASMSSPSLQLLAFVVYAAIVLATGFGALGSAGAF